MELNMAFRTLAAFLVIFGVLIANGPSVGQNNSSFKVGNLVVINMSGELAKEYMRQTASNIDREFSPGLVVSALAVIDEVLEDGKLRIEHTNYVSPMEPIPSLGLEPKSYRPTGSPTHLVTLTGTIDPQRITTDVSPEGTLQSKDPNSKSEPSVAEVRTLRIDLPDLKGLKLRTWTLTDEAGEK